MVRVCFGSYSWCRLGSREGSYIGAMTALLRYCVWMCFKSVRQILKIDELRIMSRSANSGLGKLYGMDSYYDENSKLQQEGGAGES
jgi:hypothetical protein